MRLWSKVDRNTDWICYFEQNHWKNERGSFSKFGVIDYTSSGARIETAIDSLENGRTEKRPIYS